MQPSCLLSQEGLWLCRGLFLQAAIAVLTQCPTLADSLPFDYLC